MGFQGVTAIAELHITYFSIPTSLHLLIMLSWEVYSTSSAVFLAFGGVPSAEITYEILP